MFMLQGERYLCCKEHSKLEEHKKASKSTQEKLEESYKLLAQVSSSKDSNWRSKFKENLKE